MFEEFDRKMEKKKKRERSVAEVYSEESAGSLADFICDSDE